MQEKVLSIQQINGIIADLKDIIKKNAEKGIMYKLDVYRDGSNIATSKGSGNNRNQKGEKRLEIIEEFNDDLNAILSNPDYSAFYCLIKHCNNKVIFEDTIPTKGGQPINIWGKEKEDSEEKTSPAIPQKTVSTNPTNDSIRKVLAMMGYNVQSLNGVDDDYSGIGTIMQVRDTMMAERFEKAEKERRFEELVAEKGKLENKLENLQKELNEANKYSDELEDKIDGLEEKIEELEHLKPEYSIAGTSLVGILEKTATNLAIKHADVLGGLAGVSKEEMVSMLQSPTTETVQQPTNDANVEVSAVSPRSQYITAIGQFVDTLDENEFNELWSIMQAFAKDKSLINKTLTNVINE